MSVHPVSRLLLPLAFVAALAGCGALEQRPEPALTSALPPIAAGAGATGADADAAGAPGIRSGDPRLKLNLHVFGLSYHTDRAGTRDRHLDNELNLGLGLDYEFHDDARGVANLQTGFFKDSGRNWATLGGAGYQFKLGARWRLGADLLAIHSRSYNNGRSFVAPIPRLTYDFGPLKLNVVYVPRYQDYNRFAVFGLFISAPLATW